MGLQDSLPRRALPAGCHQYHLCRRGPGTASAAFGMVKLKGLWPIMVAKRRLQTSHAFWTLTLEGETNPVDIVQVRGFDV